MSSTVSIMPASSSRSVGLQGANVTPQLPISAVETPCQLDAGTADSLFTVDKIQTRFYREDCSPVNHDPDNLLPTQDLEPWYEENSNLYLFTRESFAATNARIGARPAKFVSPKYESVDIDTPDDWNFAIAVSRYLSEGDQV